MRWRRTTRRSPHRRTPHSPAPRPATTEVRVFVCFRPTGSTAAAAQHCCMMPDSSHFPLQEAWWRPGATERTRGSLRASALVRSRAGEKSRRWHRRRHRSRSVPRSVRRPASHHLSGIWHRRLRRRRCRCGPMWRKKCCVLIHFSGASAVQFPPHRGRFLPVSSHRLQPQGRWRRTRMSPARRSQTRAL